MLVQSRLAVLPSPRREAFPRLVLDAELVRDEYGTEIWSEDGPEYRDGCADGGYVDLEDHEQDALGAVPSRIVGWNKAAFVVDCLIYAPRGERDNTRESD
jgi:hypothetical protein